MSNHRPVGAKKIVAMMMDGWELGSSSGVNPRYWLQKPGLCVGGETVTARYDSVQALAKAGEIEAWRNQDDPFWLTRYRFKARP